MTGKRTTRWANEIRIHDEEQGARAAVPPVLQRWSSDGFNAPSSGWPEILHWYPGGDRKTGFPIWRRWNGSAAVHPPLDRRSAGARFPGTEPRSGIGRIFRAMKTDTDPNHPDMN